MGCSDEEGDATGGAPQPEVALMILNSSDVARRVAPILCRSPADKNMKHISDYAA